ncbi:MAG TPA: type II toxin-antitoxin system death-on-curing family toxin [Casimicrobiaceae bacterium]|nr:type II toxin-antitoxin system death-on-curing family toxin [Casimicrobiaceae bacterium]
MIIWLEKEYVLLIHDRQLAEHGGSTGLRDDGLLESALVRPRQLQAYGDPAPDIADLAAALAYRLARNHPFVDGNKRTAAVCCESFIELNGATLEADDVELYEQYLAVAEGKLTERAFAAWLRERLQLARPSAARESHKPYRAKPSGARRSGRRPRPSA